MSRSGPSTSSALWLRGWRRWSRSRSSVLSHDGHCPTCRTVRHGGAGRGSRTSSSKTRYAFKASAIRTRPPRRRAEAVEVKGVLKSVPNRPSQQVRREWAGGEPISAVVPPLPVNRSGGKPWLNLGSSSRRLTAESLTSAETGGGSATGCKQSPPAQSTQTSQRSEAARIGVP
jgi:hypothetical protein